MFESILPYRRDEASLLSQQIASRSFPQAVLFSGPRYSGRMTLAMESARVLSCTQGGSSRCSCPSCMDFSSYGMSNVVVVGNRDHWTRINASLESLSLLGSDTAKLQLIRSIRIMMLQYHGALLGSSDSKGSAIFNAAGTVDEALLTLDENAEATGKALADRIRTILKPLQALMKKNNALTIGQVRALQDWTMQTSFGNRSRFLILEGMEMSTEGARNSLLKLLEEPPDHTYVMLLSEYPSRLLATILSRVQRHQVKPLSVDEKNRLLSEVFFAEGEGYDSVEEFFLQRSGVPCGEIADAAGRFAKACVTMKSMARKDLESVVSQLDEPVRLEYFLGKLEDAIRQLFLNGEVTVERAVRLLSIAGKSARTAAIFNQNGSLMVESLHYRLLEVS